MSEVTASQAAVSSAPDSPATVSPATSRRTLLCGAAAVLAAGGTVAVSGCSSSSSSSSSSPSTTPPSQIAGATGASTSPTSTGGNAGAPVAVGPASDVPVGGGKIYRDQKIVVTQPTAGQYKAFSARCTHAGCIVAQVKDNQIQCPCHGSRFGIADGSVQDGPAPRPLPSYPVTVEGGTLKVTLA